MSMNFDDASRKLEYPCKLTPVLKAYGLSSLAPEQWEEVDHATEGPLAGTGTMEEQDPLGLRGRLSL